MGDGWNPRISSCTTLDQSEVARPTARIQRPDPKSRPNVFQHGRCLVCLYRVAATDCSYVDRLLCAEFVCPSTRRRTCSCMVHRYSQEYLSIAVRAPVDTYLGSSAEDCRHSPPRLLDQILQVDWYADVRLKASSFIENVALRNLATRKGCAYRRL